MTADPLQHHPQSSAWAWRSAMELGFPVWMRAANLPGVTNRDWEPYQQSHRGAGWIEREPLPYGHVPVHYMTKAELKRRQRGADHDR